LTSTQKTENRMVYIAVPFWHENETVRNYRRRKAIEYSGRLFHKSVPFYSPLLYSEHFKEKKATEGYWIKHGLRMVDVCDVMHVLCLDGWDTSEGIKGEISRAEARGAEVLSITKHTRLSFHGSRTLSLKQCKPVVLASFERHLPETVVTHGEPEGPCRFAQQLARENGIALKLHHLQHWRQKGQFYWRSRSVLEDSEHAIFLHDGISQGTANELQMAKQMGVAYTYFCLDEKGVLRESQKETQDARDFSLEMLPDEYETQLPVVLRRSPEYQRFRAAVLARDNNKCVFCHAVKPLVVHHIVPFSKNSELALDVINGQTLCEECHAKVHGKPRKSKQQEA